MSNVHFSDESVFYIQNAFGLGTGRKILNKYCGNEWDGYSIMIPSIPNLSKHIDFIHKDKLDMSENERQEQKSSMEYEAEVIVFRALERMKKHCVILHGFKYNHLLFEAVFPDHHCTAGRCKRKETHSCHKQYSDPEGETDFLVIGKNFFATFEVKHCRLEKIAKADNLGKGIQQTERTEKFLKRIMELVVGSSKPIFKFCTFPLIKKEDAEGYLAEYLAKHPQSDTQILFEDDFDNFNLWWNVHIEGQLQLQFTTPLKEEIKEIVTGLSGSTTDDQFGIDVKHIDDNLRTSKITREFKKGGKILHNNTEVITATEEMKMLDIKYLRETQKAALDDQSDRLLINGPAGTGKTIVLQAKLLNIAMDVSSEERVIVFSFGHKATAAYIEILKRANLQYYFKKIGNNLKANSLSKIRETAERSFEKILLFSITIIDYSKKFLDTLRQIIEYFKDCKILIDDIQCLLTPKSAKPFEELIGSINKCSFVRMTVDAVQLFYHPKSEKDTRAIDQAIRSIESHMKMITLQSNMRNSYEVSSLLSVVREQFKGDFYDSTTIIPSQKYSHYIHGPKVVVNLVLSNKGGKLNDKINEILRREMGLLDLQDKKSNVNGNIRKLSKQEDFQIVRLTNPKVNSKRVPNLTLDDDLESCSEKIRYCYSREWAAVVGLISIDRRTLYREFLARVYLAVSRARVYCSLVLYVEHDNPPDFLKAFLDKVESGSSSVIVKRHVVKRFSVRSEVESATNSMKKMRLEEDKELVPTCSTQQDTDMESA